MNNENTRVSAFPGLHPSAECRYNDPGMTLRDYFAAKAMWIMWEAYDKGYCGPNDMDEPNIQTISEGAYQIADAMIKARGK